MVASYAYDAPCCAHEEEEALDAALSSIYLALDNTLKTPQIQSKAFESPKIGQEIVWIEGTMTVAF